MLKNLIREGGLPAHLGLKHDTNILSKDYLTCYVPPVDVPEEIKMNQSVELKTEMQFKTHRGRALVSLNPKLKEYFRDLNGDIILDPGETYAVTGKAKKNIDGKELAEDLGWLYRVSIISGE